MEVLIRKGVNANGQDNSAFSIINGKETELRTGFYNSNVDLALAYEPASHTFTDDLGNLLGKVYKTADGKVFHGFSSGSVYVEFRVSGLTGEEPALFNVVSVAGQKFNSKIRNDKTGPMIKIAGQSGEINVGDEVTVYPAIAFDLLSGAKSIHVSVTHTASGKATTLYENVPCAEAFTFKVTAYGTYSITYTAYDNLNRDNSAFESISVADRVPPEIELNGIVPEAVKVGTKLKLPKAVVQDDYSTATLTVYAIAPDADMIWIKDYSVKLTQVGKYKIVYFAVDATGSSTIKTFDVWVTK